MSTTPLLLTRCQIDREIRAEVYVHGIPTVQGMDRLIDILVSLRNSWRELHEEPIVQYRPNGDARRGEKQ